MDLRAVVDLFRANLGKIVLSIVIALGLTCLYLQRARPIYTASATLEVADRSRQDPNPTELDAADLRKTIELKMASQSVLLGVIRSQHLAARPEWAAPAEGWLAELNPFPTLARGLATMARVAGGDRLATAITPGTVPADAGGTTSDAELVRRLAEKISVKVVRGSRLIALTVEDHDPEQARRLAQAVIDEFFHQSRDSQQQDSVHARELLQAEAQRVGADYKASQEKLEAYRSKFNEVSLQDRQNIVVERLRDLNQQVAVAKNVRLNRESEQNQVARLLESAPEQLLGLRSVADSPDVIDLRKQIALQEAQVATLEQRYGPLHPTLMQAKSQLEQLRIALIASIRKAGDRVREAFASARATETALEAALVEQEKAALELDRIAIPYRSLEHEVQANASMYQKVLDHLKQFDVEHGLVGANDVNGLDIRVIEAPLAPQFATRPRPRLLLALALGAGLFFGCGLALMVHALDNSVATVEDAEAAFGRPVLSVVPRSRHHRLKGSPLVVRYPSSIQAEAFRTLRTALSLADAPDDAHRCVLFTSAIPGEGKSFCSINCAASYAQQGRRTLLIDGDLRRPSLQWLFADPNEKPDLSACLRQPDLFPQAVLKTPIDHLFRLGDWRHHPGSAELLGQGAMKLILQRALAEFDRVVIDSAPLMAVSDTLHLAQIVPTVCVVIHAGKTPKRLTRRALKLLEDVAKRPASGLVLNKLTGAAATEHYYYYNT